MHMQQLDLDIKRQANPIGAFNEVMDGLYPFSWGKGYLVFSGNDYHYYNSRLVNELYWENWIRIAGTLSGVDKQFCNISLKDRFSVLRLDSCSRKPTKPIPVYEVSVE